MKSQLTLLMAEEGFINTSQINEKSLVEAGKEITLAVSQLSEKSFCFVNVFYQRGLLSSY